MKNKKVIFIFAIMFMIVSCSFFYSEYRQYELRQEVQKVIDGKYSMNITYNAHKNNHYWYYFYIPNDKSEAFLSYYKKTLEEKGWTTINYDVESKVLNMTKRKEGVSGAILIKKQIYDDRTNFYIGLITWDTK